MPEDPIVPSENELMAISAAQEVGALGELQGIGPSEIKESVCKKYVQ